MQKMRQGVGQEKVVAQTRVIKIGSLLLIVSKDVFCFLGGI
jgi:hypothetical protein